MTEPLGDWKVPLTPPSLAEEEIHVWRVNLDLPPAAVQRLGQYLSPDERERAQRFYFEHLRRRFTAARGALREILGAALGLLPAQLKFSYEPYGKPRLDPQTGGSWISFNLAHSHELALIAVTRSRMIGVDLEYQRPIAGAEKIAEEYFSPQEYDVFRQMDLQEKLPAFYRCWTRKEAFVKAIGEGLSHPLDRFIVSFAPGEPARLLEIGGSQEVASEWGIFDLNPGPGYTAALAVKGSGLTLSCWQWVDFLA